MRRTLAVVLLALAVVAAAATLPACGLQDKAIENTSGKIDVAKDAAAKAELMMIKTGVQAYVATNGSAPADASQATLGELRGAVAGQPVQQAADGAGGRGGRLRLHAGRRHGVHPGRPPLGRQHVHGAVIARPGPASRFEALPVSCYSRRRKGAVRGGIQVEWLAGQTRPRGVGRRVPARRLHPHRAERQRHAHLAAQELLQPGRGPQLQDATSTRRWTAYRACSSSAARAACAWTRPRSGRRPGSSRSTSGCTTGIRRTPGRSPTTSSTSTPTSRRRSSGACRRACSRTCR